VLAALVTNDVALFVVIPFTVVACRIAQLPARNVVMLEVVAANLIGCLTPLGNPQNLYLYGRSGWTAETFIRVMLPFVLASGVGLLFAIMALVKPAELERLELPSPVVDHVTALTGIGCFALILAQIFHLTTPLVPAAIALAAGAIVLRRKLVQIDYSIIPLFFFAFIVVDALQSMNAYRWLAPLHVGDSSLALYLASIGLSQFMSNVPATILLAPIAHTRWQVLLYGVNAGGCGTIIASLANLLGWQIFVNEEGEDEQFFVRFFLLNCAFLLWIAPLAWLLI
jgi:Na+/H+ antiporter NhaD/arsenite permease-like protein